ARQKVCQPVMMGIKTERLITFCREKYSHAPWAFVWSSDGVWEADSLSSKNSESQYSLLDIRRVLADISLL
ncbi:hypothetical protein, partial [Endozoicomonas sp. ONNA2]|uniref:hypothetical protein n=1 Tax=Endozoicomonas sp. ONNA2 TaxID=2828741 RepID=UPI00214957FE